MQHYGYIVEVIQDAFIYSAQLDLADIHSIHNFSQEHSWDKAQVTRGYSFYEDNSRTNHCFTLSDEDPKEKFLAMKLDLTLRQHVESYVKGISLFRIGLRENYQFLKYNLGEKFDCHFDGTGIGLISNRMISVVLYLNDDYQGGEIEFPFQKISIKPKKGLLLIFPSNFCYAHIAKPVTEGTKYSIVTWYHAETK